MTEAVEFTSPEAGCVPNVANGQIAFDHWRQRGEYLPDFMRDFHDQKDLFKALQDVVERSNAKNGPHRNMNAAWSEYHVYTVDIFLWVLAAHGYTLQRSRRKFGFRSIYDFVSEANRRAREASSSILTQMFAKTGNLNPSMLGISDPSSEIDHENNLSPCNRDML